MTKLEHEAEYFVAKKNLCVGAFLHALRAAHGLLHVCSLQEFLAVFNITEYYEGGTDNTVLADCFGAELIFFSYIIAL